MARESRPQRTRRRPERLEYRSGTGEHLGDTFEDDMAVVALHGARFSGMGSSSLAARVRWWTLRAQARGLAPCPLATSLCMFVVALLKKSALCKRGCHGECGAAWR